MNKRPKNPRHGHNEKLNPTDYRFVMRHLDLIYDAIEVMCFSHDEILKRLKDRRIK